MTPFDKRLRTAVTKAVREFPGSTSWQIAGLVHYEWLRVLEVLLSLRKDGVLVRRDPEDDGMFLWYESGE